MYREAETAPRCAGCFPIAPATARWGCAQLGRSSRRARPRSSNSDAAQARQRSRCPNRGRWGRLRRARCWRRRTEPHDPHSSALLGRVVLIEAPRRRARGFALGRREWGSPDRDRAWSSVLAARRAGAGAGAGGGVRVGARGLPSHHPHPCPHPHPHPQPITAPPEPAPLDAPGPRTKHQSPIRKAVRAASATRWLSRSTAGSRSWSTGSHRGSAPSRWPVPARQPRDHAARIPTPSLERHFQVKFAAGKIVTLSDETTSPACSESATILSNGYWR